MTSFTTIISNVNIIVFIMIDGIIDLWCHYYKKYTLLMSLLEWGYISDINITRWEIYDAITIRWSGHIHDVITTMVITYDVTQWRHHIECLFSRHSTSSRLYTLSSHFSSFITIIIYFLLFLLYLSINCLFIYLTV